MSLRVAAYCRVSTEREDQANSLHSQQRYFGDYIAGHQGWALGEIYADAGLSGTGTRKRGAFNRMMADAEEGRLDLILTKEVSRFARNTVDALSCTRRLAELGVGVLFLGDGIDTRAGDGELRLAIMASIAQEESRKTSERVKWGQKRRMEQGVVFGNDSTYGFETRGGVLSIRGDQAAVVQLIFHKCLEGKGTHVIAQELFREGFPPPRAADGRWSPAMVLRVLHNEKFVGDLLQKKSVTTDYLTHRRTANCGREEQVYLRDHHEAVVARHIWDQVQAELARRNSNAKGGSCHSNRYWCSGKILCGICGGRFVPRKTVRADGAVYLTWGCHNRVRHGNPQGDAGGDAAGCGGRMVNHKSLTACVKFTMERLGVDVAPIAALLLQEVRELRAEGEDGGGVQLAHRRRELERKKARVLDAYFSGLISKEELLEGKERCRLEEERLAGVDSAPRASVQTDAALARALTEECDAVFGETVEQVVVHPTRLDIYVRGLPFTVQLEYSVRGSGSDYLTTVEGWAIVDR